MSDSESIVVDFSDLSFFDNLALFYLCNETPPQTLALAFLNGDPFVCGPMLGVLDVKRRQYVHEMMVIQKNASEETQKSARDGMMLIADGLISRNLIQKKGRFFYGVKK